MKAISKISRRKFLALSGYSASGLLLSGSLPGYGVLAGVLDEESGGSLNVFVSIQADGQVDIIAHRSEMGTGIRTSLPQIVADEMGADWSKVKVIQGLANKAYGSQNTDGSRSVRDFYTIMRQMGASARFMLERAAAQVWAAESGDCHAESHEVKHKDGRVLAFAQLAAVAATMDVPEISTVSLKSPDQFNYIGKNVPIVDLKDMTTGNTVYGIDVHLPGMLYASIERTPALAGEIISYDADGAAKVAGVVSVLEIKGTQLPAAFHPLEGVAVIAENTWSALKGREALKVKWRPSEHANHNSKSYLDSLVSDVSTNAGELVRERGDVDAAMAANPTHVEAIYTTPYLAHASMEPPMATASLRDGKCEVWACTQTPQAAQQAVADALSLDINAVIVHVTLLGGGFGRKSKPDFIVEAALLAKRVGRPVQVVWSREDDIRHDYFHSCSAQYYKAALDGEGAVIAWLAREATPPIDSTFAVGAKLMSDGALSMGYGSIPFATPNIRLERNEAEAHVRIGWLRAVYNVPFCFGIGSFVDELAYTAKKDPKDFLLEMIGEDRHLDFATEGFEFSNYGKPIADYPYDTARLKQAIRLLSDEVSWGKSMPEGEGWGISALRSFLSYIAVAVKVKISSGKLEVVEMHCVADCGTVVNPDRVHAQLEGAMVFGLSLALMGEISFAEGVAVQSNFHDYPVARINQTPAIMGTTIIPSDAAPTGIGEPGVPPVAPAIANAIFAATGQRLRELPFNKYFQV
jgi:isoquinoline 1-oxidoreductase beta subunit